jgi:hypothetical protein
METERRLGPRRGDGKKTTLLKEKAFRVRRR